MGVRAWHSPTRALRLFDFCIISRIPNQSFTSIFISPMAALRRTPNLLILFSRSRHFFFSSASSPPSTVDTFRAANSAILKSSDPNSIADNFIAQSTSSRRFARHRRIYDLAVRRLSRFNRPDLIERILEHQKWAPAASPLSEGFYIRLITLYSNAGMPDQALATFTDLITRPHEKIHTEKSLCAILTALLNHKSFDRFHDAFYEFPAKMSISPGIRSYNLILKAYCEGENRVEMAVELIEKMEKEARVSPDIYSFNLLLGGYLRRKDWVGFDKTVKEVDRRGLKGNETTYKYRIARLCADKECARARKLLDEMVSKGIKPSAACYNAIVEGFCNVGDLDSAMIVMERMENDGYVLPCSLAYSTLLRQMVKEGEFESGLEVCKKILTRKWVPPLKAVGNLVKGLVDMSKSEEAKEMVENMKRRLKGPAVDSWGKIEAALPL